MKSKFRIIRCISFIILFVLFLSACGGNSTTDSTYYESECIGEDLFGPEGGVIEITDTNSPFYGLRIVIPTGALNECRSLYVDEGFVLDLPIGCNAYPHYSTQINLGTGSEKPYYVELEFNFPVTGMVIEEGESPCAFGYDRRTEKWNVILPDSFDNTKMTVTTTYQDYWTWGKIDLNAVSSENLIGAMKEKLGEEKWDSVVSGIIEAIDVLETLYVDRTCSTWTRMRDVDLPDLIQTKKDLLVSYQSQIGQCGTCDLFSLDFGLDLSKYVLAKTVILTSDLWDLFLGQWAGFMPFLDKVEFFIEVERYIAISFIESQVCDYTCVTNELGLSVYSTYATHHVYMITHYMVSLAIDGDFWVSCP